MNDRATSYLEEVGLMDKINQKPNQLSGGQRQRVAIARALVNNPPIILADEPTGSLYSKTGAKILNILKKMRDEYGVTLIIVTHDLEVANLADRIIQIRDGKIAEN